MSQPTTRAGRAEKARAARARSAEMEGQALAMRRQGKTYAVIGERLGVTTQHAHRIVRKAIDKVIKINSETAEHLRQIELMNLDAMQAGLIDKAEAGDVYAVDRILKIQERRAKLTGIDAPDKVAQTDSQGNDIEHLRDLPTEELEARLEELREQQDGRGLSVH